MIMCMLDELLMSCRMLLEILSQEFVVMMEDWEQVIG